MGGRTAEMTHLMPENVPEEDFTTITDVNSIYDLFNGDKISLNELDRLKSTYYTWYNSPKQHTTVLRFYRQPDGTMTIYEQVYVKSYGEGNNPKLPEVEITELGNGITAHIPGLMARAELSRLDESGVATYGLEPDSWFWFNRLINQSEYPHIGTLLLDEVLGYFRRKNYSIVNQVNAYGDISQKDLEDWYIRKGFTPVDYGKHGNALLKWVPGNPTSEIEGV